jgi:hypothetical protein
MKAGIVFRFAFMSLVITSCFLLTSSSLSESRPLANPALVASFEKKLQHVQSNSNQKPPDSSPTEFSEQEINAYFASGNVELPNGVRSVVCQEQPGIVIGTSRVDFDQLKSGKNSYNPLLSVFSGIHDVVVSTHAYGSKGEGFVHVDSVSLDGVEVPQFVLELFVEKYLKPKYPNVGIDSRFALPARVDAATVGVHKVSLIQK